MKSLIITGLAVMLASTPLYAAKSEPLLDRNLLSLGGGLSLNSIDGPIDDEIGAQFLLGYQLDRVNLVEGVDTSIEVGYMDYGYDRGNTGGLWINGVIDGYINNQLGWLARLGLDLGDDDGLMLGAGVALQLSPGNDLRFEYVIRDTIDSLQVNYVHRL